jgi:uncharacterized protein YbaA (DUF1428 family)
MSYVDGFVIPVRTSDREAFLAHARKVNGFFVELGALRVVECWGDDVPHGTRTDFHRAVEAEANETIAFSWIEWPDRATRDAAMAKLRDDPVMMAEPMPFDGKRMIFGGFAPIYEVGSAAR